MNSSGKRFVAYYHWGTRDLIYGTREDLGGFEVSPVDTAGFVGEHASIRLDARGQPHLVYFDRTLSELRYAEICP